MGLMIKELLKKRLMDRTDIINFFIKKYGYFSYLEIGVNLIQHNFDKVIAPNKTGVDPNPNLSGIEFRMTSNNFFIENNKTFDIIFIDGLHHADQVYEDIKNSINVLNDGGVIILHDCCPTNEKMQLVPQIEIGEWTGDVWKAFIKYRTETTKYNMFVINTDFGVGIIKKSNDEVKPLILKDELSYDDLVKNRIEWLNLINTDEIELTLNKYGI